MHKNKPQKSYILYALHVPILVLVGLLAVGSYFSINKITNNSDNQTLVLGKKSNKGKGNDNGGKINPGQAKKIDKTVGNTKGNNGSSKAAIHRKNVNTVVENLEAVLEEEEGLGNEEVADEIMDIISDESEDVTDVTEAMEEIEGRPAWKTALLGSDYKNLGQLRSSLVKNRNRIRKLTKSANKIQGEDNQLMYQEQLQVLNQEKERITSFIQDEESKFSILGWVSKLFTGYDDTPIDDGDDVDDVDVDETVDTTDTVDTTETVDTEPEVTETVDTEPIE